MTTLPPAENYCLAFPYGFWFDDEQVPQFAPAGDTYV